MSSRRGRDRVLSPTCSVAIPTRAHVWGVLTVSGTENQLEIESERERVVGDTALKSICRDSLAPSSSISWVLCKRLKFTNLRAKAGGQGSAQTPSGDRSTGRRRCRPLLCWPGTGEGHICHSPLTWLTNTVCPTSTFP